MSHIAAEQATRGFLVHRAERNESRNLEICEGTSALIQEEGDFPGLATAFGWTPCPECKATDGTIDCAHRTAEAMIAEAREFLASECLGKFVKDPGYFC